MAEISELLGKTIKTVVGAIGGDEIIFSMEDGTEYRMCHYQDCCEGVNIDDIVGDLSDLIDSPITLAEEVTNSEDATLGKQKPSESFTWTFYKLATVKGYVDIKWLGESNGYYSESVDFVKIN